MSLIDFILNLAGLMLWVSWRATTLAARNRSPGISLAAALQPTAPPRTGAWIYLASLALLLGLRSWFYWQIGAAIGWVPRLRLGILALPFRSDFFGRMALFSTLSFILFLAAFYFSLCLLSAINRSLPDNDRCQKWVRLQLGWLERLPALIVLLTPFLLGAAAWAVANPWLVHLGLLPRPASAAHLAQQALVFGAGALLTWKYLVLALLLLHVVNAYVFMGDLDFWRFMNHSARQLLKPVAWLPLRAGVVDLAPLVGMGLVLLVAELGMRGLIRFYQQLPL